MDETLTEPYFIAEFKELIKHALITFSAALITIYLYSAQMYTFTRF